MEDATQRDRLARAEIRALRARLRDLRRRIRALPDTGREYRRAVALELGFHQALMRLIEPRPDVLTETLPVVFDEDD